MSYRVATLNKIFSILNVIIGHYEIMRYVRVN